MTLTDGVPVARQPKGKGPRTKRQKRELQRRVNPPKAPVKTKVRRGDLPFVR